MKTKIYFVRHGEVHNPKKIFYGRLPNFRLSKKGKLQIENTAEFLLNEGIEIIYSSPLLRARQSAEILRRKLNLDKIHFSNKILEVKSSLQGQPIIYLVKSLFNIFSSSENKIAGETIKDLSKRMEDFIKKIILLHHGKRIAVVSHGDPIMIVKARKKGTPITFESIRPYKKDYIKHGGIYLLKI